MQPSLVHHQTPSAQHCSSRVILQKAARATRLRNARKTRAAFRAARFALAALSRKRTFVISPRYLLAADFSACWKVSDIAFDGAFCAVPVMLPPACISRRHLSCFSPASRSNIARANVDLCGSAARAFHAHTRRGRHLWRRRAVFPAVPRGFYDLCGYLRHALRERSSLRAARHLRVGSDAPSGSRGRHRLRYASIQQQDGISRTPSPAEFAHTVRFSQHRLFHFYFVSVRMLCLRCRPGLQTNSYRLAVARSWVLTTLPAGQNQRHYCYLASICRHASARPRACGLYAMPGQSCPTPRHVCSTISFRCSFLVL